MCRYRTSDTSVVADKWFVWCITNLKKIINIKRNSDIYGMENDMFVVIASCAHHMTNGKCTEFLSKKFLFAISFGIGFGCITCSDSALSYWRDVDFDKRKPYQQETFSTAHDRHFYSQWFNVNCKTWNYYTGSCWGIFRGHLILLLWRTFLFVIIWI